MTEDAAITDTPLPQPAESAVPALEARVRHLEEVVAVLQDTRALEERVTEQVVARVGPANGISQSAGLLLDAGRHLLPSAVGALAAGAGAAEAHARAQVAPTAAVRSPWLLFEVYAELRAMVRMYLDPRFRLTWQAWLLPVLLLSAIATSWIWLPGTAILPGIVSTLVMKVVDLFLALVMFKVLHREVTRYRASSPDLPPSLRL